MSLVVVRYVRCDHHGCWRRVEVPANKTVSASRRQLREAGWGVPAQGAGGLDFCANHHARESGATT